MAFFANTEELNKVMEVLWNKIKADPEMSKQLAATKLIVQFRYRDPDGIMTVDCSDGETLQITFGKSTIKPVIEMSMKADMAHEFWLGKTNVPMAILSGKIVSKGPTPKALALLPAIKPAYAMYPEALKEVGKATV